MDKDTLENNRLLLDYAAGVSVGSRGLECSHLQYEVSGLFAKQVYHAYSAYAIVRPFSRPELLSIPADGLFFDFGMLYCIARVMLEVYARMCDLAFTSDNEDEREFNLIMWDLLSETKRLQYLIGVNSARVEAVKANVNTLCEKIRTQPAFYSLDETQKQSIESKLKDSGRNYVRWTPLSDLGRTRGNSSPPVVASKYGFSEEQAHRLWKLSSQYVHSESFSISQVLNVTDGEDQLRLCELPLQFVSICLSTSILEFRRICPDAFNESSANDRVEALLSDYANLAILQWGTPTDS